MKREFAIGDRVRVYCTYGQWDGRVAGLEQVERLGAKPINMLMVENVHGIKHRQHPKQCRLLPEVIWVNFFEHKMPSVHKTEEAARMEVAGYQNTKSWTKCFRHVKDPLPF